MSAQMQFMLQYGDNYTTSCDKNRKHDIRLFTEAGYI